MSGRPLLALWRDALRDDQDLDRTALLVGFVLSTYMDALGHAFPSKATLARGCRLGAGRRAVDGAVDRLEAAGYLRIKRSKGRRPFTYQARLPTSQADATFNVAFLDAQRRTNVGPTSHPGATECAESAESVSLRATRAKGKGRAKRRALDVFDQYEQR